MTAIPHVGGTTPEHASAIPHSAGLCILPHAEIPAVKATLRRRLFNKEWRAVYESLELEKKNGITLIYLNRPKVLNALDMVMRKELICLMDELEKDEMTRVIVLAGKGRAFCAGGDINTMKGFKPNDGRKRLHYIHRLIKKMISMEKPIIAAVHGYAVGAGWNLALACDMVVATKDAKFCQSFVKVGLIPDCGGMFILPRLVGLSKAKELMLTAKTISAEEAYSLGLVNQIVEEEELLDKVTEIAKQLANGPSIALGICKTILNRSMELDLDQLLEYEAFGQDLCMMTEDFEEGLKAFKEKRKPQFKGK